MLNLPYALIRSRAALDPKSGRTRVLAIPASPFLHALCLVTLLLPSRAHDRCWNGGMHADGTANPEIEMTNDQSVIAMHLE